MRAFLFAVLSTFVPLAVQAQSADAILAMCKRDANNTLRRLQSDIGSGLSSLKSLEENCIRGPKADQIRSLPGYPEILELHKQARALVEAAETKATTDAAEAKSAALGAGPGGDAQAIRARWSARPARCQEARAWDEAAGVAPKSGGGTARIAGLEGDSPGKKIHPRVFDGKGSAGRWPSDFTPDDHLVRILCGKAVEGIDPFFSAEREIYSTQFLENDSRQAQAEAIQASRGDPAHLVLYRAALLHECFQATGWDLKKDYEPYLYCLDSIGTPPTEAEVRAALETVFPGRDYERDNLLFLTRRATTAMGEVQAAFAKLEAKYPRMKAVYRDSALQARARWEQRRQRYAATYQVLDPITARLLDDPESAPPADCERQLLELREQLAKEIPPRDADGVRALRVEHPLGYQITEALAYCYLGTGKLALAKREADALKAPNRRIDLAEELFYARADALDALVQELKTKEKIQAQVPNYRPYGIGAPLPGSVHRRPRFFAMIEDRGRFEVLGESGLKPAVVAAKKTTPQGVQLVFQKYTYTYKYRDSKCKETGKIDHYEFQSDGSGRTTMKPIYRLNCWSVGPEKSKKTTYQEQPVVLPADDAQDIQQGLQLTVLVNKNTAGDAAVLDAWLPKQGRDKARVLQGIRLR